MKKVINRTGIYLIIFTVFLLLVNATLGFVLMVASNDALREMVEARMLDVSNTAASMIDGDILAEIQADDFYTKDYQSIMQVLTKFRDNISMQYIYCLRDMGDGTFVFTIDPTVPDPAPFGKLATYTDALYKASLGTAAVDKEPYEDDWGEFYSAYTPVFTSGGEVAGIVGVDFSIEWYEHQMKSQVKLIAMMTLLSLSCGAFIVFIVVARYRKRFDALYSDLNELSDGIETLAGELSTDGKVMGEDLLEKTRTGESAVRNDDDFKRISDKIRSLQDYMRVQINYVRGKTYRDGLTNLENRTAYFEYVEFLEEQIREGSAEFTVGMFDINGLKGINDAQGHDMGDRVIKKAAEILRAAFGGERIFRIGGDEFVVVSKKSSAEVGECMKGYEKVFAELNNDPNFSLAMSKGCACFDSSVDHKYRDTFARADRAMYEDKRVYYESHGDRRGR
jgi:diguanylate cyclase (GGDEF)-like protein